MPCSGYAQNPERLYKKIFMTKHEVLGVKISSDDNAAMNKWTKGDRVKESLDPMSSLWH